MKIIDDIKRTTTRQYLAKNAIRMPLTSDDFISDMRSSNVVWKIATLIILMILITIFPIVMAATISSGGLTLIGSVICLVISFFLTVAIFDNIKRIEFNENGNWCIGLKKCSRVFTKDDSDGITNYYMEVDGANISINETVWKCIDKDSPILCLYQTKNGKKQLIKTYNEVEYIIDEYKTLADGEYIDIKNDNKSNNNLFSLICIIPILVSILTIIGAVSNIFTESNFYKQGNELQVAVERVEIYEDSDGDEHKKAYTSFDINNKKYENVEISGGSRYTEGDKLSIYINGAAKNREKQHYTFSTHKEAMTYCYVYLIFCIISFVIAWMAYKRTKFSCKD